MFDAEPIADNPAEIADEFAEHALDVDPATGLFGVMTRPSHEVRDTAFVLINSGLLHRVGPFRLYVDIARQLATAGYPSIRLDLSGKGDSDALTDATLAQATIANISAACRQISKKTGVKKFVIGGLCSGADDALQVASQIDGVAGILMFDGYAPKTVKYYICRYAPQLLSLQSWLGKLRSSTGKNHESGGEIGNLRNWGSPKEMMARYRRLVDEDVSILAIYTGWLGNCYLYDSQLTKAIKHPNAAKLVSEVHFPAATHLFALSEHRQQAVDAISQWADQTFDARSND